jgi:hypothetical protein
MTITHSTIARQPVADGPDVIYCPEAGDWSACSRGVYVSSHANSQDAWNAARAAFFAEQPIDWQGRCDCDYSKCIEVAYQRGLKDGKQIVMAGVAALVAELDTPPAPTVRSEPFICTDAIDHKRFGMQIGTTFVAGTDAGQVEIYFANEPDQPVEVYFADTSVQLADLEPALPALLALFSSPELQVARHWHAARQAEQHKAT